MQTGALNDRRTHVTHGFVMRRANADSSHNITVSMVNDFFNLSAPKPQTEACPKVRGRRPNKFDAPIRENGINFKLTKSEDPERFVC